MPYATLARSLTDLTGHHRGFIIFDLTGVRVLGVAKPSRPACPSKKKGKLTAGLGKREPLPEGKPYFARCGPPVVDASWHEGRSSLEPSSLAQQHLNFRRPYPPRRSMAGVVQRLGVSPCFSPARTYEPVGTLCSVADPNRVPGD